MKKTYDRKVFKRKLLSDRRTVTVTIRLFMILLLGFPLLTKAGTVDSTRVANREVRGKVVDEKKLPIPGVSVRLGGTSMGTATDVDGKFKLLIPARHGDAGSFLYRDEDRDREDSPAENGCGTKGVDDRVAGRGRETGRRGGDGYLHP